MHTFVDDLKYALRSLRKAQGFTVVAVLTMALGIGANTAIFSFANAMLLRPLPYARADRLVMVWQDMRARGGPADEWATPGNYADWRAETNIFERLAVISGWRPTMTGDGEPESIPGEQVSHEYFDVLGITPILGRAFAQRDDVPNASRVAVIGNGLWKRRFGGDRGVIGRIVTLSGEPHQIIGVLPEGFRPIVSSTAEIWRPLRLDTATPSRGLVVLRVVARLRPGVTVDRAQAAGTALAQRLEAAHPDYNEKTGINLTPLHERVVGDVKPGLLALVGGVAFVLLIACANIANLLLARGSTRTRELAVRAALGASRMRVVRQLMTESLLLAAIGGAAGILAGAWALDALIAIAPPNAPRLNEVRLDAPVILFGACLTILAGVLFGLAPAFQSFRWEITHALKEGTRGAAANTGAGLRRALVVAEVALALVLLTAGSLLLQSFVRMQSTDLGFDPANVLVAFVNPPRTTYKTASQYRAYYDQVLERASALPGVRQAALASVLPLSGDSDTDFAIDGRPAPRSQSETPVTWYREVSAGYFDAMGMRLQRGRTFSPHESAPSVVINETFARKYFPGENPIGRRIRIGGGGDAWFTIVGIAKDVKVRGARGDTRVETFIPYWQMTEPGMNIVLKSASDPAALAAPLKRAVQALDAQIAVSNIATLSDMVAGSIEQPRFLALLAMAFAVLALVLAAVGIYGVMAYSVAQRTDEIGVRMALGATPRAVLRLVAGDGLRLAATGVVLGAGGSLLVARALRALLFAVEPGDPTTLILAAAALLLVAGLASFIPARRATRVDPLLALRAN